MAAIVVDVRLESGIELNLSVGADGQMMAKIRNHPADKYLPIWGGGLGDILESMRRVQSRGIPAEERQVSGIVSAMLAD